jgi:ribonuclease T2
MDLYWKDSGGDDESFWEHEWDKHGTCISTLEPSCYTGYTATQEVVDFFQKTVDLFQTLDSYTVSRFISFNHLDGADRLNEVELD